jgi:hypothetical protein
MQIYHIIAHEIECLSSSFLIDIGAAIPTHMANEDTLEKSVRAMTIA